MNREQIYDTHISPLMTEIIRLCKAHDIPMVASFQYNDDRPDGDAKLCTTFMLNQQAAPCDALRDASSALRRQLDQSVMMFNVRDRDGNLVSSTAILK